MYTPHTERDIAQMLDAIGVGSLDDLLKVPEAVALREKLDVVPALPEYQIARRFDSFAKKNVGQGYRSFLGAGAYRHYVPPAIPALAMRGEFLTAYTPYQAEVSQGYLQAIYEWQTYICLLTGMDISNASVYDGATALAEGGWFDSAHEQAVRETAGESDPETRMRALRTLLAEETRLGMMVGVAVGFELCRALSSPQP